MKVENQNSPIDMHAAARQHCIYMPNRVTCELRFWLWRSCLFILSNVLLLILRLTLYIVNSLFFYSGHLLGSVRVQLLYCIYFRQVYFSFEIFRKQEAQQLLGVADRTAP